MKTIPELQSELALAEAAIKKYAYGSHEHRKAKKERYALLAALKRQKADQTNLFDR